MVFQPRKVERSGISEAVEGNVLIYIHKEEALDDVEQRYPAQHYVLVDDKLRTLTAVKKALHSRVTTVFPRQGQYAHDRNIIAACPPADPHNLGPGWMGYDFAAAFKRPVKVVNDAAMQALGSYKGGKMLFLGLGTGLGSAMIVDGIVEPMELGHLPYKRRTFEDYVGVRGYDRLGKKKWRQQVADVIACLIVALEPEDVVVGGGNVKRLKKLPPGCRAGDNANAFLGGFRLWRETTGRAPSKLRSRKQARAVNDRSGMKGT